MATAQVVVPRLEALLVAGDLVGASSEGPGRGGGATLSEVAISGISCASLLSVFLCLSLVRRCFYDPERLRLYSIAACVAIHVP